VSVADHPAPEPVEYLVAHVRSALLDDERLSEQAVEVVVASGRVVLRGEVATPERRAIALEVARSVAGDDVVDDLCVSPVASRTEAEDL
jgi:osmotically-inducible protein OsmY